MMLILLLKIEHGSTLLLFYGRLQLILKETGCGMLILQHLEELFAFEINHQCFIEKITAFVVDTKKI